MKPIFIRFIRAAATVAAFAIPVDALAAGTPGAPPGPPPMVPAAVVPAPTACSVPELRGLGLEAAKHALQRAHCALGKVTKSHRSAGHVSSQSVRAGTVLGSGTAVHLRLAARGR